MCSKCYRNIYKKRKEAEEVTPQDRVVKQLKAEDEAEPVLVEEQKEVETKVVGGKEEEKEMLEKVEINEKNLIRCEKCSKKLGLTAIRCRCGLKFCSKHRYSDQHDCAFDYKTHGRKELEEKNPQVIGTKLQPL